MCYFFLISFEISYNMSPLIQSCFICLSYANEEVSFLLKLTNYKSMINVARKQTKIRQLFPILILYTKDLIYKILVHYYL
jgi:hypothetical protein